MNSVFTPPNGDGRDGSAPNEKGPKRSAVESKAPYPQGARTTPQEATDLEELEAKRLGESGSSAQHGFLGWNQADAIELPKDDLDHATCFPELSWPTNQVLFGDACPQIRLTQRILIWAAISI